MTHLQEALLRLDATLRHGEALCESAEKLATQARFLTEDVRDFLRDLTEGTKQ